MNIDILFRGSGLLLGMAGLWLIYWFLLADRAKGRKRCPKCWYDMPSADSLRCPECGNDAKREADLLKTRRRWKNLWMCLLVFLAAGYLWIHPKVKQDGWASVLPNTVLIFSLRLPENDWAFAELGKRTTTTLEKPYSHVGVLDSDKLYQWQWRLVGNACIDLMRDDQEFLERWILLDWLYLASISLSREDAYRYFRATIPFLSDDDPEIRSMVIRYCADARFVAEAIEAIRPLLDDPIQQVRVSAVDGLGMIGLYSSAPLSILVDALEHEDAQVRVSAVENLGSVANFIEEPKVVFETLVNVHETDSDVEVRAEALRAICKFKSQKERAIEFMREAFSSTESVMRKEAIWSLLRMEQFDETFDLEFALNGLTAESADVRWAAARILENRISIDSLKPHEEFLRELADSDDENVRMAVRQHLRRIQDAIED